MRRRSLFIGRGMPSVQVVCLFTTAGLTLDLEPIFSLTVFVETSKQKETFSTAGTGFYFGHAPKLPPAYL
jgi:hypothetical protein